MTKRIFLIVCILFGINSLKAVMIPKDIGQEKTIIISGEQISKKAIDEALALIKQWMERRCSWGDYEKNQEISLRFIYTFGSTLGKRGLFVLVENERKEIWPFEINGDSAKWKEGFYFLDENNETVVLDENDREIGHKFFEKGAMKTTITIEGTFTLPPMRRAPELQKKEVECVKQFVIDLIKENKWEEKFPDGLVYLWIDIWGKRAKYYSDIQNIADFFIENNRDWGFFGYLEMNEERTKCEFYRHKLAEKYEYSVPDFFAEKMKMFYHKEIIKIEFEI